MNAPSCVEKPQLPQAQRAILILSEPAILPGAVYAHLKLNNLRVQLDQDLGLLGREGHTYGGDRDGGAQHHGGVLDLHHHAQLAQHVEHRHGEVQSSGLQHDLLGGDGSGLGEIGTGV